MLVLRLIIVFILLHALFAQDDQVHIQHDLVSDYEKVYNDVKKYLDEGNYNDAMQIFDRYRNDWILSYELKLQHARALVQMNHISLAEEELLSIIKERKNHNLNHVDANIMLARLYSLSKRYNEASPLLYEIDVDLISNDLASQVYSNLGKIALSKDENFEQARTYLMKAWDYTPNDATIAFELGMIFFYGGRDEVAREWFLKAEELNEKIDHKLIGKIYLHYKHLDWAADEFEKIILKKPLIAINSSDYHITPIDSEMFLLLGECREILGDINGAKDLYNRVLDKEPHNALAHTALGLLLLGTGSRNFGAINACGSDDAPFAMRHLVMATSLDVNMKRAHDAVSNCEKEVAEAKLWKNLLSVDTSSRDNKVTETSARTLSSLAKESLSAILNKISMLLNFPSIILQFIGLKLPSISKTSSYSTNTPQTIIAMRSNWDKRMKSMKTIESRENISADELLNEYILKNRPVVISREIEKNNWKNFSKESLIQDFGTRLVKVSVSPTGRFDGPENGELWNLGKHIDVLVRPPTTTMQMSDFIKLLNSKTNEVFYLEYAALHQYLGKEFEASVHVPKLIEDLGINHLHLVSNVWIGGRPTTSPLHYDDYENFLCQIYGQKEVILFPPSDLTNLYFVGRPKGTLSYEYPNKFTRNKATVDKRSFLFGSSVSVDNPDLNKYPLYAKATPYRVLLNPGDILYLPAFWNHEVQSIPDEDIGLNMAVNFWYSNMTFPVDDSILLRKV